MSTRFIIAALPLALLAAGCANQTLEQKTAQYDADVKAIFDGFKAEYMTILTDPSIDDAAKAVKVDSIADIYTAQEIELCKNTVKHNRDNGLGVRAITECSSDLTPELTLELIANLKGEAAADPKIAEIRKSIEAASATAPGQMFTDFEVDGVKFSDFVGKGKYVLVDFWASWCGPCKREIPNIAAVYNDYAGPDFDVLSIAVWDKPEDTAAAAAEHGVVWSQIVNAQQIPTDIYGINGIPHIMLIGPDGIILQRGLRGEGIRAAVSEALGR